MACMSASPPAEAKHHIWRSRLSPPRPQLSHHSDMTLCVVATRCALDFSRGVMLYCTMLTSCGRKWKCSAPHIKISPEEQFLKASWQSRGHKCRTYNTIHVGHNVAKTEMYASVTIHNSGNDGEVNIKYHFLG